MATMERNRTKDRRRAPEHRPMYVPSSFAAGSPAPRAVLCPSEVVVHRIRADALEEHRLTAAKELASLRDPSWLLWIEVTGLSDVHLLETIAHEFHLHELSLEDVLDPSQRGKAEHYENYTFVVMKTLSISERIEAHSLSAFLGDGFVLTVQDVDSGVLDAVRSRLRAPNAKLRRCGGDYLAYAILDAVIDHYFPVLEEFDDHLESVEDAVLEQRGLDPIDLARAARQDLQVIRHAVWPARDIVTALLREDVERVSDDTRLHLRDCYDHITKIQEMIESSREIAASLLESYLSRVSLRTNEIMRLLTVISTVFIPLTFIVGVYGMNFNPASSPLNMPELNAYWGYPLCLLTMFITAVGTLLYFRRKGWFTDGK